MTSRNLIGDHLGLLRSKAPLIHNITNYVAMNFTANALLAIGASPIMAHAEEEVGEILAAARSLVINIGTLDPVWIKRMMHASQIAKANGVPAVLDPVGAGASSFRTGSAHGLLEYGRFAVLRGNASEILALAISRSQGEAPYHSTHGVESTNVPLEALEAATDLARKFDCVVCVSGEVDLITDGSHTTLLRNGHPLMAKVTGMGCATTALIGAFLAIEGNPYLATRSAMAVAGIAGELAAARAQGPGSFSVGFLDALAGIRNEDVVQRLKLEER